MQNFEWYVILNNIGLMVQNEWIKTGKIRNNVIIDEFIIMPNHLHGIIVITGLETPRLGVSEKGNETSHRDVSTNRLKSGSLGAIINQFKSKTTKEYNFGYDGTRISLWQPRFYEHIIRNDCELLKTREYIINNPMKWYKDEYYR